MNSSRPTTESSFDSVIQNENEIYACRDRLRYMARQWMSQRLRHRIDSSDLIQETLLIALSQFSKWLGRPKQEVYRWMVSVLRNCLLNHARDESIERCRKDSVLPDLAEDPSDMLTTLLFAELREIVDQQLQKISPTDREIFELHYYEGMSFDEIAKQVNRTKPAVRSIHFRVLKTLRPRIEKHFQ